MQYSAIQCNTIMQYFIVSKAFKALSYCVFVLFYLFFLLVQKNPIKPKNPLGWALKKRFFNPDGRELFAAPQGLFKFSQFSMGKKYNS